MGKPARFLEVDLTRVMNAAAKSKARDWRVDIQKDGTISVICGAGARPSGQGNSCDDLLP